MNQITGLEVIDFLAVRIKHLRKAYGTRMVMRAVARQWVRQQHLGPLNRLIVAVTRPYAREIKMFRPEQSIKKLVLPGQRPLRVLRKGPVGIEWVDAFDVTQLKSARAATRYPDELLISATIQELFDLEKLEQLSPFNLISEIYTKFTGEEEFPIYQLAEAV